MQQKLYYACLKRIKIKIVAKVIAYIFSRLIKIPIFLLIKIGVCSKVSKLDNIQARNHLNIVSKKPIDEENFPKLLNQGVTIDLSIIISAYNAEKTILRCLDSIILPLEYKVEVIVVNDGSTDCTGELLEEYQQLRNIIVITQSNKGFSGARNTGIEHALCNYMLFLDSDDALQLGAITTLLDVAIRTDAKIVSGAYHTIYKEKEIYQPVNGFAWGKVFKRELFEKIRFPKGYLFEDTIMAFLIYRYANKSSVVSISDSVYRYYKNDTGITATYHLSPRSIDAYWIIEKMYEETIRLNLPKDNQLFELVFQHLKLTYWRTLRMNRKTRESVFILASDLMCLVMPYQTRRKYDFFERNLLTAYKKHNFFLWELCSFITD